MLGLGAGALAVDLGPGIGVVDLDMLDIAAREDLRSAARLAVVFEPHEDLVLDLHVPGVIVFAGLDHRARRRYRVAATLHLDRVEIGPVGQVVIRVALARHEIAGLEVDKFVGAGADRLQIGRRVARGAALVILEQVLRDDHAALADKGVGPERRRLGEANANGMGVDFLDLDVLVAADRRRRGRRVGARIPN